MTSNPKKVQFGKNDSIEFLPDDFSDPEQNPDEDFGHDSDTGHDVTDDGLRALELEKVIISGYLKKRAEKRKVRSSPTLRYYILIQLLNLELE
jgi:hypothetical protein